MLPQDGPRVFRSHETHGHADRCCTHDDAHTFPRHFTRFGPRSFQRTTLLTIALMSPSHHPHPERRPTSGLAAAAASSSLRTSPPPCPSCGSNGWPCPSPRESRATAIPRLATGATRRALRRHPARSKPASDASSRYSPVHARTPALHHKPARTAVHTRVHAWAGRACPGRTGF